jgi:hypothetical protein
LHEQRQTVMWNFYKQKLQPQKIWQKQQRILTTHQRWMSLGRPVLIPPQCPTRERCPSARTTTRGNAGKFTETTTTESCARSPLSNSTRVAMKRRGLQERLSQRTEEASRNSAAGQRYVCHRTELDCRFDVCLLLTGTGRVECWSFPAFRQKLKVSSSGRISLAKFGSSSWRWVESVGVMIGATEEWGRREAVSWLRNLHCEGNSWNTS